LNCPPCTHACRESRDCPARRARDLRDVLLRARTWLLRVLVSFLMLTGFLPPPLLLVWLEWLRECMKPDHPGMPTVVHEIAEVQERCRA
jgi:hypothetical protein